MATQTPPPEKSPIDGSRRLALEHYNPGPLRRLSPALWKQLIPLLKIPSGDIDADSPNPEQLLGTIRSSPSSRAFDFLQMLHDFGNETGRHVLHDAAIALRHDRGDWPPGAEDLAAELWCRATADPEAERLRAFAEVSLRQRAVGMRYRTFYGQGGVQIDLSEIRARSFRDALSVLFAQEQMSRTVRVRAIAEDDRVVLCVFHGGRLHHIETLEDDGEEGVLSGRPRAGDVLAYEEMSGKLHITTRSESLAEIYRTELGRAFFDDDKFFADEPTYDLAPIAEAIRRGALPSPGALSRIREVALVDFVWATGDGFHHHVHGLRGRDCIVQLQRARFPSDGDVPLKATLAFTFREDQRVERMEVVLRPSNRFDCPKGMHRDAIEEYLERIGVFRLAGTEDASRRETVSLLGVQTVARWRRLLGDSLQKAIDRRLLLPAPCTTAEPPGDGGPLRHDPVTELVTSRGTLHVAVGSDDVRVVTADRMQGYEFDLPALSEAIRQELRCVRSAAPLPFGGAVDLGPAPVGNTFVHAVLLPYPAGVDVAIVLPVVASLAGANEQWIMLLPPGAPTAGWHRAVTLRGLVPPLRVRADVIRALRLHDQVPVYERSNGEELVVDHEAPVAWLHGEQIDLAPNEWRLLKLLASRAYSRRPATTSEINEELSPHANSDAVAKQCVNQLNKKVRDLFRAQRKPLPEEHARIIDSAGKNVGYRLKPSVYYEGPPHPPTPPPSHGAGTVGRR